LEGNSTANEKFPIEAFENACNRIFPGAYTLVRDVNLPEATAAKYKIGMIIREPAFCDATYKVGGMVTTHRYAICTNHHLDTTALVEKGEMWGLCICQKDSRYKVLDIYTFENKTQILLLHLDEDWQLFQNIHFNILDDLVKKSRERFENKCTLPPIPEVTTPEWLDRCASPVGIDDKNEFFPLT